MLIDQESESISLFLERIARIPLEQKEKLLSQLGDVAKKSVIKHMPRSNIKHVHMKDDVQKRMIADKLYGGKMCSIGGGKKTGTKWHLVNDGTYRTRATHFIDKAMQDLDSQANAIIDSFLQQLNE